MSNIKLVNEYILLSFIRFLKSHSYIFTLTYCFSISFLSKFKYLLAINIGELIGSASLHLLGPHRSSHAISTTWMLAVLPTKVCKFYFTDFSLFNMNSLYLSSLVLYISPPKRRPGNNSLSHRWSTTVIGWVLFSNFLLDGDQ